jgi:reversibly glycosylated polypeptide/UDP-arabinopyranose mutase
VRPNQTPTSGPRVAVVVPSNRPAHLATWIREWTPAIAQARATPYYVRDEPATWDVIRAELGRHAAWIIPRQSDGIRMWGFLQALRDGAEIIITMDDDCYPGDPHDAIQEHVRALTQGSDAPGWGRTIPDLRTRGIPHGPPPGVNHGLWTHVPDVDGITALAGYPTPAPYPREQFLNPSLHYPLSGMNLAWRAEWTPTMFFGGMGTRMDAETPWGVHRFGDIWAGLLTQRVAASRGTPIRSGTPFVHHARASDPVVNERRERPGHAKTPALASAIHGAALLPRLPIDQAARMLADSLTHALTPDPYWSRYLTAWRVWLDLTHVA